MAWWRTRLCSPHTAASCLGSNAAGSQADLSDLASRTTKKEARRKRAAMDLLPHHLLWEQVTTLCRGNSLCQAWR